jgi:maltose-binding protein MalE
MIDDPKTTSSTRTVEAPTETAAIPTWLNGVKEVAGFAQVIEKMERETGIEPATSSLGK